MVARVLKLDGQLLANGATYTSSSSGGGAGGSLWISAQQLLGSATTRIQAVGGNGTGSGGAGGGGRIALYHAGMLNVDVFSQISVAPGTGSGTPGVGTLHLEYRIGSTAVLGTSLVDLTKDEVQQFTIDFNSAVSPASISSETVWVQGPTGAVAYAAINPINPAKYLFQFTEPLPDGEYELRVAGIRSAQGRGMDQDGNGIEDEPNDIFLRKFVVDRSSPEVPQISAPLVAPAVNELTVRKTTIIGSRDDNTEVLVDGVKRVVLGSGVWTIPDFALAEGKSELHVSIRDAAGNVSPTAVTLKFDVDSVKPSLNQSSHSGSIREVPSAIWVTFTEAGSGLDLAKSGITLKRAGSTLSGQLSQDANKLVLTPFSPLLEGSYSYDVRLQDKFGNLQTASYSFTLDYTPPVAVVVSAYPAVTTSAKQRFAGTKEAGAVTRIRSAAGTVLATSSTSGTTWQFELTLSPGDNPFTVDQTDAAGNVSPVTSFQIRFDDQAPGPVAFTAEPKGSGTSIKLSWPTYDEVANGNDIKEYRVYSAAAPFTSVANAQLLQTVTAGIKQLTISGLVRDEQRYYAIVAVDQQGLQQAAVAAVAVTPDDVVAPEEAGNLKVVPGAQSLEISWTASANSATDLAGYALYVGAAGEQRINLPLADLSGGLRYTLSNLQAANAYPLKLVAVDSDGNESVGVRNPGVTWLTNPQGLEVEGFANRFDAKWQAAQPAAAVSAYRIYVADAPFSSVVGMTPRLSRTAAQLSGSVAGLQNGQTYYVAVTVLNTSGGENSQVQAVSVTPSADTVGPVLSQLNWSTATGVTDLLGGGDVESLGELLLQARDESGIARIEVSLDGQPLGQALQSSSGYKQALDLTRITDGEHVLAIKLIDTLDNATDVSVELDVDLDAPAKPTLRLQNPATTTNTAQQTLVIRGQVGASAQIELNDNLLPSEVSLGTSGESQVPVTLSEGENQIVAKLRHASRTRFSAESVPLNVTLDTTQPDAPAGLQALSKTLGVVQLSWSAVSQGTAAGYNVYVASQPFTQINESGVTRVNTSALTALSYTHKPTADGTYYYRVTAVNKLGSESALSVQKSAVADRVVPQVLAVTYSSQGAVSADGRFAPARVDVRLQMTEPLRNAPFLSLDVPEGASIPVRMTQAANDPLYYQGSFDITTSLPSGLLYARVSAYDVVGNEGTDIGQGRTLRIDTQGPDVQQLSLLPESPVENLVANNLGREVQVILRLSEDPVGQPQLIPQLNGTAFGSPVALSLDAQSKPGSPILTGSFRVPVDAGKQQVDLLGFAYSATDDLGNKSERIQGRRDFQVYQGNLPPLDIPQGLTGKALSSGRVALAWKPVAEVSVYRLMRRAEAETAFRELARVRDANYEDNLPVAAQVDGVYFYQVASVREHEGKEAISQASEAVRVAVDSEAPSVPRELQAEMNGAGVVLRWQPPVDAGTYTYNLYRVDAAQGEPITVAGITALQTNIPELIALDSKPSDTEHAYTVTAVDAAGNESAPADSAYLNSGLLPVRDLKITLRDGEAPLLQWDHSGKDVVGYNVYVGAQGAAQKLNSQLIQTKQYQDEGLALPLAVDRRYQVTAVDAQGVESVPHALLLPALRAELRADQRLLRGVFNTLHYRISNSSQQALTHVRLRVNLDVSGTLQQHLSDYFDVAAAGLSEVPVIVGGYPELPGVVPLSSELVYAPAAGEEVLIQHNETVQAGESAVLVQLLADDLTRGGVGQVRLRLENPSDVATELVTAKASGSQASDEMRLVLEDLKGNVLSSQPIKAYLGNGLVTVRDGRTVARVGALDVLETGPFTIDVPAAAPDQVRLRLEADYLHYQTGLPTELKIRGVRSSRELTLVESPYVGELTQVSPQQVQAGDKVTITGRALKRDTNQPLADVELSVVLNVRGFERVVSVTTDAQGAFTYEHQTEADESGTYQVSIVHPGISTRPQHGQFLVQGAAFSPANVTTQFPRNYEQVVTVVVDAGYDTALNNLRLEYLKPAGATGLPTGIKVQLSPAMNLAAKKRGNLTLRITGDNSAAASGLLDYRIVADGLSKSVGQTRIQYSLVEARPVITLSPNQIRTGLKRGGDEQVETINLKNTGLDVLRNVRLSLVNSEGGALPQWVSLRSSERPGDLAVGAGTPISVAFKPGDAVAEGNYYITLRIQADNHPQVDVAMEGAVTQSGQGGVIFQVSDIYTGTKAQSGELIPGLAGAKIKLQNRNVLTEEYSITSDARGQALVENIPAGEYTYRISAWDHDDLAGQLWIKPGMTQAEPVFLMSKLVTVEWSVKEITLEDRYEVVLDATFKTNVPTALVMIEPLAINLPAMRKGDVFQGELTMTNYGLVRADDVKASLPTGDARAKIEYLRPVPNSLYAGDVVIIPYRIVALQSFDPDDVLNGAAGCWSFNYQGTVSYSSYCANGVQVPGKANVGWFSSGTACSAGGGGGGGGAIGGGGAGGWGGWGGSGGSFIPKPTPITTQQCVPDVQCKTGNCPGANGGGK
ncbi:Ig-like domain-containing protein [Pseudomonas sp. TE3786]